MPKKPITIANLRRIVAHYGSVTAFAQAVPVSRRMATYWLAGVEIHPKWQARMREMEREKQQKQNSDHPSLRPGVKETTSKEAYP